MSFRLVNFIIHICLTLSEASHADNSEVPLKLLTSIDLTALTNDVDSRFSVSQNRCLTIITNFLALPYNI